MCVLQALSVYCFIFYILKFAVLILFYILPNHDIYLLNGSVEYIVTPLDIFCVCELPEDGRQTGPKHVV
jgi:hypothetical protein